jgi:alkylation response protein AidB-like acyl-CoA dehydrogenase
MLATKFRAALRPIARRAFSTRLPVTSLTEDENAVRDMVAQWAQTELAPHVRSMDRAGEMKPEIIQSLFDNGLMGMEIPEEFGGSGMNFTSACVAIEEIAKVDASFAILVDIQNTLTNNAIRFWGSPELQAEWLPKLATTHASSFCLSEAGSGSDAFAMQMRATLSADGSSYTLNGTKLWISNSKEAGVFLVFANAKPELGYKGITAFVVDAATEGITVGRKESKLGLRASSTCPLTFENVVVPAANVLGEVGHGYKYAIQILNEGRIGIGAQQLGIAKGAFNATMPYLFERKQFGQRIGDFQMMQQQYSQLATEIHAVETMLYNACRMKEQGLPFVKEASMVKLYSSQVAEKVASKCIEFCGGVGFTEDLMAEKFYRDCKVGSIYEGTSNIQLQTIAKILAKEYE